MKPFNVFLMVMFGLGMVSGYLYMYAKRLPAKAVAPATHVTHTGEKS